MVVFVDGSFWHGWRFPRWRAKLGLYWQAKIEGNRRRDKKITRMLRRGGWRVVRIWEHDIETAPSKCVERILGLVHGGGRAVNDTIDRRSGR
jgi:DNA mismatch endonuclease (patch repair protein)